MAAGHINRFYWSGRRVNSHGPYKMHFYLLITTWYSTAQVVFSKSPRTGRVDFLAHRGSPSGSSHSNSHRDGFFVHRLYAEFPPQNHHLLVELRSGQKFIMASSQWKISDVRMIDSSEFFRVCMGRKSEPLFCLLISRLICRWINTEIFLPRD